MEFSYSSVRTSASKPVYSVARLNREARLLLENNFEGLQLEAEVREVTRARSGHVYFTLSDSGGQAAVSAVMWRGLALRFGERLKKGALVRCHGRVTLYEPRGSYQFVVDRVEDAGAGQKAKLLAELKARLAEEGLFDAERKRPIPPFPTCVGVVTSREGAALRDIIKVIFRRYPVRLLLAHAGVQGENAPSELVRALDLLAERSDVDLVIIGRGGGSAEDLDAFNDETVVRKVAAHPTPTISAVGHEIDISLVDLAADRRAATPSEAGEIAVPDGRVLLETLNSRRGAMRMMMESRFTSARADLAGKDGKLRARDPRVRLRRGIEALARADEVLARWPELALARARGMLAMAEEPLGRWPTRTVERADRRLESLRESLHHWPDLTLARARGELGRRVASLDALSPLACLSRGYSVVRRRSDGKIIRDAGEAPRGTGLDVTISRGRLVCEVKESFPAVEQKRDQGTDV